MTMYFEDIENLNIIKFIKYFEKIKKSSINVNNHSIIIIIYLIITFNLINYIYIIIYII